MTDKRRCPQVSKPDGEPIVYLFAPEAAVDAACPDHGALEAIETLTVEHSGRSLSLTDEYRVRFCRGCLEAHTDRRLPSIEDDVKPVLAREIE